MVKTKKWFQLVICLCYPAISIGHFRYQVESIAQKMWNKIHYSLIYIFAFYQKIIKVSSLPSLTPIPHKHRSHYLVLACPQPSSHVWLSYRKATRAAFQLPLLLPCDAGTPEPNSPISACTAVLLLGVPLVSFVLKQSERNTFWNKCLSRLHRSCKASSMTWYYILIIPRIWGLFQWHNNLS